MEKRYQGFGGLEAYPAARLFRNKISLLRKPFPPEEKYTLNQLLRSVRFHYPEFIQFCRIARGSLNETPDHLICACDEGYISVIQREDGRKNFQHILRWMNGFINYLNKQYKTTFKKETIPTNTTNTTTKHA